MNISKENLPKYRIVEFKALFEIQAIFEEETGYLWWKKKKYSYRPIDINGGPCFLFVGYGGMCINTYNIKNKHYSSLEEAKEAVKLFEKGIIIHNIEPEIEPRKTPKCFEIKCEKCGSNNCRGFITIGNSKGNYCVDCGESFMID